MISLQKIYKSFGRNHVLKGIDLSFQQGGLTAVLGPNGSGKTTLIKCLLGMVVPDRGRIFLNGQDIAGQWAYRSSLAYLPQIARFPENLEVKELLEMIGNLREQSADYQALVSFFELEPFMNKRLGYLSGGTRQKVNIVQAFMYDCPLIILDEPTAGLDPLSVMRLKELIEAEQNKGKTILLTTHIMSLAEELARQVIYLLDGKIHFQGTVQHLRERYDQPSLETAIAQILLNNQLKVRENGIPVQPINQPYA